MKLHIVDPFGILRLVGFRHPQLAPSMGILYQVVGSKIDFLFNHGKSIAKWACLSISSKHF